jgi:hypothetical protein
MDSSTQDTRFWKSSDHRLHHYHQDYIKIKYLLGAGGWLIPVILATQDAEIRIMVRTQPRQIVHEKPYLRKTFHKKRLAEWLKV